MGELLGCQFQKTTALVQKWAAHCLFRHFERGMLPFSVVFQPPGLVTP
ncbi:hypothetical protein RHOER0001_0294 [Rhodococcus erythropolis SK121]|nr:hypothetical protein RHOER0001_0294 [Rhodococcus erythropolis SK121]